MARVSRVLPHLTATEIQEKIRTAPNFRRQQKWLVIYNALVDPRTAAEIAKHTGKYKVINKQRTVNIDNPSGNNRSANTRFAVYFRRPTYDT